MFKMVDYIVLANRQVLRDKLAELGMVSEEGTPDIPVTKVKVVKTRTEGYGKKAVGVEYTVAVARCTERKDQLLVEDLEAAAALRILGYVDADGKYMFDTDPCRVEYEKLMEVGEFRSEQMVMDEDGNWVVVDGQPVMEPTSHPYRFGVFF